MKSTPLCCSVAAIGLSVTSTIRTCGALARKPKLQWVKLLGPSKPVGVGHCRRQKLHPCARRAHTAVAMGPDKVVIFGELSWLNLGTSLMILWSRR